MDQLRAALLFAVCYSGLYLSPLDRLVALLEHQPAHAMPALPPAALALAEARNVYQTRCSGCHGASGHGDGPAAESLTFDPPDCRDAEWQRSRSDAELREAVLHGGAANGGSSAMPPHGDLEARPAVLDGLVLLLRQCRGLGEASPSPAGAETL